MEAKVNKQKEKFNEKIEQFSVTLNKKHFDEAIEARDELKKEGTEVALSLHTVDTYKKSFTFPQIAHNDYAVE